MKIVILILVFLNILFIFTNIKDKRKTREKENELARKEKYFEEQSDYLLEEIERLKEKEDLYLQGQESSIKAKLANLEESFLKRQEDLSRELEKRKEVTTAEFKVFEESVQATSKKLEEDARLLQETLKDLKSKKAKSIEVLRAAEKKKNEKDFNRILLNQEDKADIDILMEVEKKIHNKDVLRKLIYKTYIESAMNNTFNEIGVITEPGIYKIENIQNGKTYIGQSTNVRNRLREHVKSSLGISTIAHQAVHEAIYEEGLTNFTFEVIEACDRAQLNNREKYWIEFFQSAEWGYNKTKGNN